MLVLFALLLHAAAATPTPLVVAPARPELTLMVTTDGGVSLDERTLAEIADGVRDIWRPYVDVTFSLAGDSRRLSDRNHVRLVITDRMFGARNSDALGWIDFVDGRPSQTITVSLAAARAMMEASSWKDVPLAALPPVLRNTFVVRAISRAVAHEIGHYLLESKGHTRRGLMRERFTADDLTTPRRANDRLDPADVEKLRRELLVVFAIGDGRQQR